jgi:hypothetical protein
MTRPAVVYVGRLLERTIKTSAAPKLWASVSSVPPLFKKLGGFPPKQSGKYRRTPASVALALVLLQFPRESRTKATVIPVTFPDATT